MEKFSAVYTDENANGTRTLQIPERKIYNRPEKKSIIELLEDKDFIKNCDSADECGICLGKKGLPTLWWPRKETQTAHEWCYNKIKDAVNSTNKNLDLAFPSSTMKRNEIFEIIVAIVEKKCGCSLSQFVDSHSVAALKALFDEACTEILNKIEKQ